MLTLAREPFKSFDLLNEYTSAHLQRSFSSSQNVTFESKANDAMYACQIMYKMSPFVSTTHNQVGAKLASARSAVLVSAEAVSKEGIVFYMFEFKNEETAMRELYQVILVFVFKRMRT